MGRAATAAAARPTRTVPPTRAAQGRAATRRGSGRRRRPAAGITAAVAVPVRVLNAPFARTLRVRTARVLDALLSGRGWIALIGVLLAGIVFFNVDLLQMNRDIARDAERASTLKRENARLRLEVARLASSERIQEAAARLGLVLPAPGEVRYLKAHPTVDARRAAKRITEPDATLVPPAPVSTVRPGTTTTPPGTTTPPATTPPTGAATTTPDGTATPQATAPGVLSQSTTGQTTPPATGQTTPPATGQTTPPATGQTTPPTTGQTAPPTTGQTTP
jgi:cell division protein FtsL